MAVTDAMAPAISIIISTYNRADMLREAIGSVLAQPPSSAGGFELLVVDNNSSDHTQQVIEEFRRADPRVHYILERKQGLSHARNAGIARARAPILTFTDDDVRVAPGWIDAILTVSAEHPEADVIGGRVLPEWPAPPPAWLTPEHWTPLALVDYGDRPVRVAAENPLCLVGANLTVRRRVFDLLGPFAPDLQRVKDGVGSCEDLEFLLRLYGAGRFGIYDPRITTYAAVQDDRLEQSYHRRWHFGHGHFRALMRADHFERSDAGTLFGVPAHLYRQAASHAGGWLRERLRGNEAAAFRHETALHFFRGFYRTRRRQFRSAPAAERWGEIPALCRGLVRRRQAAAPARVPAVEEAHR